MTQWKLVPCEPKDWWVFNTGAPIASGLSLQEALDYLTPERLNRGWSVVCVIDKDNPCLPKPDAADVQELVEALRRLEEVASDCDIGYMDNAVRHARRAIEKWEGK